jgi:hypothetical protein
LPLQLHHKIEKKKKPWCQGFFLGEFSPLANKKIIIATHTNDFCEKKVPKSLNFKENIFEITIFRQ